MEEIFLDNDIEVGFVTARSFPEGVMEAHKALHQLLPLAKERKRFGISRPENGQIVYRAAVEVASPGEAESLGSNILVIAKGKYISAVIHDFMKNLPGIEMTFKEMLSYPGLDPFGYCVEWYLNEKDVKCMIRLTS